MRTFDKRCIVEIVLYILNKTHGLDYYRLFKIIYFANLSMLAKTGLRMIKDTFTATPNGAVPSILYICIKKDEEQDKELSSMLDESIEYGAEDACYMLTAKRKANLDYLSEYEVEELDKSILDNTTLSFEELRKKSQSKEWKRAFATSTKMNIIEMIREVNDDNDFIEYVSEQLTLEKSLE